MATAILNKQAVPNSQSARLSLCLFRSYYHFLIANLDQIYLIFVCSQWKFNARTKCGDAEARPTILRATITFFVKCLLRHPSDILSNNGGSAEPG